MKPNKYNIIKNKLKDADIPVCLLEYQHLKIKILFDYSKVSSKLIKCNNNKISLLLWFSSQTFKNTDDLTLL